MKKIILLNSLIIVSLVTAQTSFAQEAVGSSDVQKVQGFITNSIKVLTLFAASISGGFFTWGGYGYITSSGNPEGLERSKKTILYSAVGLSITSGAYVLTNIVQNLAKDAFGTN